MPTIFIALQCCQCSTMQVKQRKKSSNKWTCVVCNQKQSVWKVFAQGFMAKDVRKFVQSFNMSRQLAEQNPLLEDDQKETLEIEDQFPTNRKQKRTDWSEYIDPAEEDLKSCDIDEKLGDEFEPKIVTEMPKPVFKKPKLKNYSATFNTAAAQESSRGLGRMVGVNPKRRENAAEIRDRFAEAKELQPTYGNSEWKSFLAQEDDDKFKNKAPWRNQPATAKRASKWSCYIAEYSDDLLPASGRDLKIQADPFENELNDQMVEEDIHPDFL